MSEMPFRLHVICAHTPAQSAFVKLEILRICEVTEDKLSLSAEHIIFRLHTVPFFLYIQPHFIQVKTKVPHFPASAERQLRRFLGLLLG